MISVTSTLEPPQVHLQIEKVTLTNSSSAIKIVKIWQEFAKSSHETCSIECPVHTFFDLIPTMNELLPLATGDKQVYFYKDHRQVEGLMMVTTSVMRPFPERRYYLSIELLLTHPKNLNCPKNTTNQLRGVGSTLLKYAEQRALKLQRGIRLISNDSTSDLFYEKRGFEPTTYRDGEMIKSIEKIRGLLAA